MAAFQNGLFILSILGLYSIVYHQSYFPTAQQCREPICLGGRRRNWEVVRHRQ
ncbi:hypothetical protein BDZ91DRAFT_754425 [Kalaharituber pfeilii]|nr:hypothetical protein BDZ91DRAFT_754425 [Kalaharituber pfeilii]